MSQRYRNSLPIIGVMGSGSDEHRDRAEPLGAWLARRGVHLLTGGGGGVMESVSRAFYDIRERRGMVIGIIPGEIEDGGYTPRPGYPNRYVEIPIFTHLPLTGTRGTEPMSRNTINIVSSDVIVALPGGAGTGSEVQLAARYGKPVIAFCDSREDILNLEAGVPVEPDLEDIKSFVNTKLKIIMGG